jgi:hypothetical protein
VLIQTFYIGLLRGRVTKSVKTEDLDTQLVRAQRHRRAVQHQHHTEEQQTRSLKSILQQDVLARPTFFVVGDR